MFKSSDDQQVWDWANGGFSNDGGKVGEIINNGENANNGSLAQVGVNPSDASQGLPSTVKSAPPTSFGFPGFSGMSGFTGFPGGFPFPTAAQNGAKNAATTLTTSVAVVSPPAASNQGQSAVAVAPVPAPR